VFTPNGDTQNPNFEIFGLDNYPNTKFTVFDRWGKEMYSSDNYKNNWGPEDISEGTYYYIIELPFGITKEITGYFNVLR
jgi:gliding motility-associated-like protein